MSSSRKITLKTPLPPDQVLLRTATVVEQLGQPFDIELDVLSPDESLDLEALLGQEICVSLGLDDGEQRYFHALVSHASQHGRVGEHAAYRLHAVPWLWFLTRTTDCRIYQNASAIDIVKGIFREHGFTDFQDALTRSYRTRDYCVQYRESDFNFVQRLLEEEGIYYFFKHTRSAHTLVLADAYGAHDKAKSYETIPYHPPSDGAVRDKDHIQEWHLSRDVQSGKHVLTDYDFTKPRAALKTQYAVKRKSSKSDFEVFDYPGGYVTTTDGDHYVRSRLQAMQARFERTNGVGNARGIAAGCLFSLQNHPRADQNKQYLVVSATHRLDAGNYRSGAGTGESDYVCSFEASDAKEPFRSLATALKPRVGGPQTATVVGKPGEEIWTDKYGRVKVQFHWDRLGARDENSSCWVRVSQPWAGKNWGWLSTPRIGQEVVVDFLEGDPDRPLIIGGVYNQDNMPPYELPEHKTRSGLRTRSSKNGAPANFNEIRFEDKKGSEQLYIHAEKDHDLVVENDESRSIGRDEKIDIGGKAAVTIGRSQTRTVGEDDTLSVGRRLIVTAADSITFTSGSASISMQKDGSIVIKGKDITIAGSANVNVKASGDITMKGNRIKQN